MAVTSVRYWVSEASAFCCGTVVPVKLHGAVVVVVVDVTVVVEVDDEVEVLVFGAAWCPSSLPHPASVIVSASPVATITGRMTTSGPADARAHSARKTPAEGAVRSSSARARRHPSALANTWRTCGPAR
jgi:hypothetical protein